MVCAPVRSIIPSLKLGDYLSVQAHNPCSISHLSGSSDTAEAVPTNRSVGSIILKWTHCEEKKRTITLKDNSA